ncbi:hypothetical protein GCM10025863_04960 [Microbacterium suwonense]|uniref:Peptide deformylase-like n=1 Tax=Microbacterium suwonense TaxID=683047 RepID=A0ABN6WZJ6_9MICO|nr:hypothetical protein GCM10025863_04960 [Microbacterium suwonense]
MTVREIRLYGDPVLRQVCAPIEKIDDGVRALIADLVETVELPGRAGVAANQIGVALRAFSYNIDGDIGYVINPVLTEVRGEAEPIGEGCLSVPGLWHDTPRHPWARVEGIDLDGEPVVLEGRGCSPRPCSTRPTIWTGWCTLAACRARRASSRCDRCARATGFDTDRSNAAKPR